MDTGSSAFILICSAMVCLMTPALAFFYGGLGRRKNVINTMMMSVLPLAIASLLWIVAGYSIVVYSSLTGNTKIGRRSYCRSFSSEL